MPKENIPTNPPFHPSVVTAGGKRLLLTDVDVVVSWDDKKQNLISSQAGWWLVNYPLKKIKGLEKLTEDQIAQKLFKCKAKDLKNWYIKTPGTAGPEPKDPSGPAPIIPTPNPTLVVNQQHPAASDTNPGTVEKPLKTIAAARKKVKPGTIIHVYPGIYREGIKFVKNKDTGKVVGGTKTQPIKIEGIRDKNGQMPVISANDVVPADEWQPVKGLLGVYRAKITTGQMGRVSMDGKTLKEANWPEQLQPGEYCFNRASYEFLNRRDMKTIPKAGMKEDGKTWKEARVDDKGMLKLGKGNEEKGIFYASTWVWLSPKARKKGIVWDPTCPLPITGSLSTGGRFRAFRQTGTKGQLNKYTMWVNGEQLPSVFTKGKPRPNYDYGMNDKWQNFKFKEGWNHLVFKFDTTSRPKDLTFRFGIPKGTTGIISQANPPKDISKAPKGKPAKFITDYLLLGPLKAKKDYGLYVRLPNNDDPKKHVMDLSARTNLINLQGPYTQLRGFEIRHGALFQQRAQLAVSGKGCVVEGCKFLDPEVRGFTVSLSGKDQRDDPIIVRNNWVINPGGLGAGASGSSDKLTAENQNTTVPGRGRMLAEWNVVINNNSAGYQRMWESGGFKMFRLTGCVLRQNTFIKGDGPGIWLDWEHFNNRIEGNLHLDGNALSVGIEASPGPNVVANNISVNLHPGGAWFRYAILTWSTRRTYAMFNTVDGRWNKGKSWKGHDGADAIYLDEGGNRSTRWNKLSDRHQAALNNLVMGCDVALATGHQDYDSGGNINWGGRGSSIHLGKPISLSNPGKLDYRPTKAGPWCAAGVPDKLLKYAPHDFYGLLRFPEDGVTIGACRAEPIPVNWNKSLLEAELGDGTMKRYYPSKSPRTGSQLNLLQVERIYLPPPTTRKALHIGKNIEVIETKGEETNKPDSIWSSAFFKHSGINKDVGTDLSKYKFQAPFSVKLDKKTNREYSRFRGANCNIGALTRNPKGLSFDTLSNQPVIIFTAPEDGEYVLYTQVGKLKDNSNGTSCAYNAVIFPAGSDKGKSIWYHEEGTDLRTNPGANKQIALKKGDKLAVMLLAKGHAWCSLDLRIGCTPVQQDSAKLRSAAPSGLSPVKSKPELKTAVAANSEKAPASKIKKADNKMMFILIGGGVLLLIVLAIVISGRKK